MDCAAPLRRGGDAIHQCPRANSWLLRGIFDRPLRVAVYIKYAAPSSSTSISKSPPPLNAALTWCTKTNGPSSVMTSPDAWARQQRQEAAGYCTERSLLDCLAFQGDEAIHQVFSSKFSVGRG